MTRSAAHLQELVELSSSLEAGMAEEALDVAPETDGKRRAQQSGHEHLKQIAAGSGVDVGVQIWGKLPPTRNSGHIRPTRLVLLVIALSQAKPRAGCGKSLASRTGPLAESL